MFRNFQGKNMQRNNKSPSIFTLNGNAFIDFIKSKGLELPFGSIHFSRVEPVVHLEQLPQFTFSANNTTTAEMGFFLVMFNVEKMKGKIIDPLSAELLVKKWLVGLQEYYHQEHGHAIEFLENGPNSLRHHRMMGPYGGVNLPSDEDLEKSRKAGLDNLAKTLFESMQYHASVHAEEQHAPYITVSRRKDPTGKLPFKLEALLPGQVRVMTSAEPFETGYGYDDTIKGKLFFAGNTYHIYFQHYALQSALGKFSHPLQLQDALFELWADYASELSRVNDPSWQALELTFDEVKLD
jgi:hypothetical protein